MKLDNYFLELINLVWVMKILEIFLWGWISLFEDELIEVYNYVLRVFLRKVIKVLKIDFKGGWFFNLGVLFGEEWNGNYWVMVMEKGDYWLLFKVNFWINFFNKDIVKFLFKFNGFLLEDVWEFILVELVKVFLMLGGD